jgi:hypothetical protein
MLLVEGTVEGQAKEAISSISPCSNSLPDFAAVSIKAADDSFAGFSFSLS